MLKTCVAVIDTQEGQTKTCCGATRDGSAHSVVVPPLRALVKANDFQLDVQALEHHIHRERLVCEMTLAKGQCARARHGDAKHGL